MEAAAKYKQLVVQQEDHLELQKEQIRIESQRSDNLGSELSKAEELIRSTEVESSLLRETLEDLRQSHTKAEASMMAIKTERDKLRSAFNEEIGMLRSRNHSLEKKCGKMREYIAKLTTKCEEWSELHDAQAQKLRMLSGKPVVM